MVTEIIKNMIQEKIVSEVKKAKVYSLQLDSTQDISTADQFSIVIQYVTDGTVNERLLSIVPSISRTGQGLFDLLNVILERLSID